MKIIWEWSIESEVNRILQSARNIGNGFYALQHFYPLPYNPGQKYDNVGVYLPDLPYSQIPHFWQKSTQLDDHTLPLVAPQSISKPLIQLLQDLRLESPSIEPLQAQFQDLLPRVTDFLHTTFPALPKPTQITVYPTYFGTNGSFNWMTDTGEIVIYHRLDQGVRSLVECVLTSILRPSALHSHHATWNETEFLVDYLLNNSVLSDLVPVESNYHPTLSLTRTSHTRLSKLSEQFLQQIGAPVITSQAFTVKNSQIYFGSTPLSTLSSRECKIMQVLIENSPTPITFDQIGDLIFTIDDKFSLTAISKFVERLRKKLSTLGISSSYLATASGVGYYLKN